MEKDDEVKGGGNSLNIGARIYDSRLGRWLSLDPLQSKYPSESPYNFVANSPIIALDPDGKKIRIYYENEKGRSCKIVLKNASDIEKLKDINNSFVKDTYEAIKYLQENKADGGIINDLIAHKKTVHIKEGIHNPIFVRKEGAAFDPHKNTVYWNSRGGGAYLNNDELQQNTPAFLLLSEFGKAYYVNIEGYNIPKQILGPTSGSISINNKQIGATKDEVRSAFKTLEQQVTSNIEYPAAHILRNDGHNEGLRTKWGGGTFYHTKGPTSTEPATSTDQEKVDTVKSSNK